MDTVALKHGGGITWHLQWLHELGFKNCLADLDVYMRPNIKPWGTHYYEYVLVYRDDVLVVSHDPEDIMDKLGKRYTLKPGSVHDPAEYWHVQYSY
jgi:hypothetical protein